MNKPIIITLIISLFILSACTTNNVSSSSVQNPDKIISDAYYTSALADINTQSIKYSYTSDQVELLQKVARCNADAFPSIIDDSLKQQLVEDIKNYDFATVTNNYAMNRLQKNITTGIGLNNGMTQIDYKCKAKIAPQLLPNYAGN